MYIRLHQINLRRDKKMVAFAGLEIMKDIYDVYEVDRGIYDCMFEGEVECTDLEEVFMKFNVELPEGYKGRSLSVSDVVEVIKSEDIEPGYYYCDIIGFCKVDF